LLLTLILITGTGFAGIIFEVIADGRCPGIYDFGSRGGFKSDF
jgi:hypothetical protein